jgi:hypothetical protein
VEAAAPDTAGVLPPDTVEAATPDTAGVLPPDTAQAAIPDTAAAPDTLTRRIEPVEEGPRVPYEIDARRFVLEGSRFFRATGSVVVTRDSLEAVADSLEYDQDQGTLFLSENASVTTARTDLSAREIRMAIPEDEVRDALAQGNAVLEGEDLTLLSPLITLFFSQGMVERLVAVRDAVADSVLADMDQEERDRTLAGGGPLPPAVGSLGLTAFPRRPYALAQDFILEGDSLEVLIPEQVLKEVRAMGRAKGESAGRDSLNVEDTPGIIRRDWLEGDTIIALFQEPQDSVASGEPPPSRPVSEREAADSGQDEYVLQQLVARGGARSMYRMAPSDSAAAEDPGHFAVHYVVGDEITILLNPEGEAEKMEVLGQTRGIHLEPLAGVRAGADTLAVPDTATTVPDTAATVPDTATTLPDTAATLPDTSRASPAVAPGPLRGDPRQPDTRLSSVMRSTGDAKSDGSCPAPVERGPEPTGIRRDRGGVLLRGGSFVSSLWREQGFGDLIGSWGRKRRL